MTTPASKSAPVEVPTRNRPPRLPLDLGHFLAKVQTGRERRDLLEQTLRELFAGANRHGRNIVDRLVRIQLRALPARAAQRIDHLGLQAQQPQLEHLEQADRPRADDDGVGRDRLRLRKSCDHDHAEPSRIIQALPIFRRCRHYGASRAWTEARRRRRPATAPAIPALRAGFPRASCASVAMTTCCAAEVRLCDTAAGRSGGAPCAMSLRGDPLDAREAHVENRGLAGHGERAPIGLDSAVVRGDEAHAMRMVAVRQAGCPHRPRRRAPR